MAKKLLTSYTFTPGAANAGTVVVPGTYALEQFLLITNVSSGVTIYQFNVPAKGAALSTGGGNTTLTLELSTLGMSSADRLQVFIDDLSTGGGGGGGGGLTDAELRATPVPVSVSGVATAANQATGNSTLSSIDGKTPALVSGRVPVDGSGVTQPVSGSVTVSGTVTASGPLTDTQLRATAVPVSVSGVATAANQASGNSTLSSIDGKTPALVSGRVPVDGSGVTQPVSGTFWQATQPISGSVSITGTPAVSISGTTAVSGPLTDSELRATAVPVSGTFWQATQPVSAASLPLPSGAAQETGGNLATLASRVPAQGQALMAASMPVAIASNQSAIPTVEAATVITGAAAQTATVNNILPATSGAAATDTANFRAAVVQVISTGTGGTFIFEQSNDNVNFRPLPVFNAELVTAVPITTAITATASQIIYTFPVRAQFTRLRIASTITGGSIQAFTRLSSDPWTAAAQLVASNTAANLAATVSGTVTSNIGTGTLAAVTAVTAANLALPGIIADVASAALTTTATAGPFTPTFGIAYTVNIPVTAVTGTTPTLDVAIEESDDSGTNWFKVYDFPRITAAGMYRSPLMQLTGNRVRYVQTVGGTTPSFTRAINRLQSSSSGDAVRQLIDRSIVLTTLNSTTSSIDTRDAGNRAQLVVNIGAATTAPALQMEGSDDNGASWYAVGTPLTAVANSTVQLTVVDINAALMRARVSTAGSGVTAGYVMIKAHD